MMSVLKQSEAGMAVVELCRQYAISLPASCKLDRSELEFSNNVPDGTRRRITYRRAILTNLKLYLF